ncbi:MAG TPA: hypothetical protein VIT38_04270 [Allosphingosinicella sp.]
MRKLLPLLAGSLLLAGPAAAERDRSPEAELARAIQGRVAGEPVDCISLRNVRSSQVIPNTAIVYDAGSVVYVNHPANGADSLNRWDTMVTNLTSDRLCSVDTVRMVDNHNHFLTGIVFLGEFVPYRRVQTGSAN